MPLDSASRFSDAPFSPHPAELIPTPHGAVTGAFTQPFQTPWSDDGCLSQHYVSGARSHGFERRPRKLATWFRATTCCQHPPRSSP